MRTRMAPEGAPQAERAFHGGAYCGLEFTGDPGKIECIRGRAGEQRELTLRGAETFDVPVSADPAGLMPNGRHRRTIEGTSVRDPLETLAK